MGSVAIFGWMLVLIVLVFAGFMAVIQVKKWAARDEEAGENFSLSDLRRLQKAGKLSTEEYEKARAALVAEAQRTQPKPPPAPQRKTSDGFIPPPPAI